MQGLFFLHWTIVGSCRHIVSCQERNRTDFCAAPKQKACVSRHGGASWRQRDPFSLFLPLTMGKTPNTTGKKMDTYEIDLDGEKLTVTMEEMKLVPITAPLPPLPVYAG